ncbi:MAG: TPR end-of-group domain-containing protein [Nevskiaceae bacterium]
MKSARRLAAIVFTDIVGYSAIVHRDEALGASLLDRQRSVVRKIVPEHSGREVETAGDSFLLEFGSALDAVQAVLAIQKALAADPARPRVLLRASVHLGDVEHRGEEVFGDGVNIAARLLPHSPEGGLALSAPVLSLIRQRLPLPARSIGSPALKNIADPVEIYVVDAPGSLAATGQFDALHDEAPRVSVCVLPFTNISGDPEQEYFSDGITEDIITDLSKVSALAVVSRNTSFTWKGKAADIPQIARQLKVSHVLEGSVRKQAQRVRITAQLIRTEDDSHIWAERYDRDVSDIFALQDEISAAIVKALKLHLMPSEKKKIEARSTTNASAYKYYLMARQFRATFNSRHYALIVRLCQRAVGIDPNYARAWALMAVGQTLLDLDGVKGSNGLEAAERALSIDPDLAEGLAARARVLYTLGRFDEALAAIARALELEPDSYDVHATAGRIYIAMKRWDDAIRHLLRVADIAENDFWALGMVGTCYLAKGDLTGEKVVARRCLDRVEKLIAVEPDHGNALGFGVGVLVRLGEKDRAMEWADRALLLDPENRNLRYNTACAMALAGETDRAIGLLEVTLREANQQGYEWFKHDTDLDSIRQDPRFIRMMADLGARIAAATAQT